ncbi:three-Cys-motif partner protein TcmP [Candidatus Pacearchaeota archaeon]|nr:three-Cys-motif partner protein TcmP [Candidatus Pacearchaeota archaeon]
MDFHNKPFDDETKLKLELFRGYTREWLPVFLSKKSFNTINIFDFFAGPGKDSLGEDGSPLILIDEIRQYLANPNRPLNKDVSIRLFLNDADPGKVASLQSEIASKDIDFLEVAFTNQDFQKAFEAGKSLLEDPAGAKLLILDQSGVKQITRDIFKELVSMPTTDFMFFISSSFLKRFIGTEEVGQYFPDLSVEDLMGIPATDVHRFMCSYYKKLVPPGKNFYLAPFSIKNGANIYGIIFGSGILLGLEKFLKVCWNKDRVSGEANYDIDNDMVRQGETLWDYMNTSRKMDFFRGELIDFLQDFRSNNELYKFTLEKGCLPKQTGEFLKGLENNGRLEKDPADTRRGSYYMAWKYYSKREVKAKFRVKR